MLVTRVERIEAVAPAGRGRFRVLAFDLEATVAGDVDPAHGMVVNIVDMKESLRQDVVRVLSGACLDGADGRPACTNGETLAIAVWRLLDGRLAGRALHRIRLAGRRSPIVEYRGGESMDVTRVYEFSASHRLHSASLSDDENMRLFGKCNNPHGHGHNYVLEVTLRGAPAAGEELLPADTFDGIVNRAVVEPWDHKNLNEDVAEFRTVNPTAEEIARAAWHRIERALAGVSGAAKLHRVKLLETARNHVEYYGD